MGSIIVGLVVLAVVVAGGVAAILGWDRYRASHTEQMAPTDEVFIDPASGRRIRVWYNARTGERDYRPE